MKEAATQAEFAHVKKALRVSFDAGVITADAGLPLVRQADDRLGLTRCLADALGDPRTGPVVHSLHDLVRCRVYGIVAGYEDCNDFTTLRRDPMFKAACGRLRSDAELPSQPTLSRLENQITIEQYAAAQWVLLEHFIDRHKRRFKRPRSITLDVDTTDDPTHGQQQFAFFHGYYDAYCYLQLLIFTDRGDLLWAELLPTKAKVRDWATFRLTQIIDRLRQAWPSLRIKVRADNGFASPELYEQCEQRGVTYMVNAGTHRTFQEHEETKRLIAEAEARFERSGGSSTVRCFGEFQYKAAKWRRPRRIIVKAQRTKVGPDVRFLVTNSRCSPKAVYNDFAHRGQQENWIKDIKCALKGGRLSCHRYLPNAVRLLFFAVAYQLGHELRRRAPRELRSAQLDTLRLRLLRVPALVKETARQIWVRVSSFYPWRDSWLGTAAQLGAALL